MKKITNKPIFMLLALAVSLSGCKNEPPSGTIAITPVSLSLDYEGMISIICKDHRGDFEPAFWTLTSNQPWLKFSIRSDGGEAAEILSSMGKKTVYLIAEENPESESRTAKIFLNGVGKAVVSVTQNAVATLAVTLLDYFENGYDKSCTMFCQAIRLAGLEDVIETGGITCVVPDNQAFYALMSMMKVTSLEEVNPTILRSLLLYLIFPGEHRTQTMDPSENYRFESLSGDPVFINFTPAPQNKYRMVINDSQELVSGSSITVSQQDYRFKNQVVAQVVPGFIIFKPNVAQTEGKPADFVPSGVKVTLTVSDDTFIYTGSNTNYNNRVDGIYLNARSAVQRYGLLKFPLSDISFRNDIVSAKVTARIYDVLLYPNGHECTVEYRELHAANWSETSINWNSLRGTISNPLTLAPIVAGSGTFTSRGAGATNYTNSANPLWVTVDVTTSLKNYYRYDSTHISMLVRDVSSYTNDDSRGFNFYDKDYHQVPPVIELTSSVVSAMTLVRNNPVILSGASAVLNPDNHFAMAGPAVPNGYHYTDANIIYRVISVPAGGILTLYGVPMSVDALFTQAEMRAGMVKYFSTTGGADSFELHVSDYLECPYADDLTINIVN